MITFENLLDSKHMKITIHKDEIDKNYVKNFRESLNLSTSAMANIFGVSKKTVEKWESGEKKITGSDAVLMKLLNDNPGLLSQIYSVEIINNNSIKTEIPEEYMLKVSYEGGGGRTISPIGQELNKKTLEELECPCCGEKNLRIANFGYRRFSDSDAYQVICDSCDWRTPTGTIGDYGEAPCEFKYWLEAFELLGRPKERVNEDLTLLFYPEGEWREKEREEREKEQ